MSSPEQNEPQESAASGAAPYVMAIDLGTSGPKVAIVDASGEVLGHEFEDTPLYLHPGGGAEQDPDDWWNAVMTAGRRLLDRELCP